MSTPPIAWCSSSCCRPSAIDYCQIDACRLGGVNEVLAVLLLAAKFGVPVCPHAGGLGLCEYVQHLARDRLRLRRAAASRTEPPSSPITSTSTSCTPRSIRDGRYVDADRARLLDRHAPGVVRRRSSFPAVARGEVSPA